MGKGSRGANIAEAENFVFTGSVVAEGRAIITDAMDQSENPAHSDVKCTAGKGEKEKMLMYLGMTG